MMSYTSNAPAKRDHGNAMMSDNHIPRHNYEESTSEEGGSCFMRKITMDKYADMTCIQDLRDKTLVTNIIHRIASFKNKNFTHSVSVPSDDRITLSFINVGDLDIKCLQKILIIDSKAFVDLTLVYPMSWDLVPGSPNAPEFTSSSHTRLVAQLWSHSKGRKNMIRQDRHQQRRHHASSVTGRHIKRSLPQLERAIKTDMPPEDSIIVLALEDMVEDELQTGAAECRVEVVYDMKTDVVSDPTFDIVFVGLEHISYSFLEDVMDLLGGRINNVYFSYSGGTSKTRFEMFKAESRDENRKVPVFMTVKMISPPSSETSASKSQKRNKGDSPKTLTRIFPFTSMISNLAK